jgi:hypothetical protein
MIAWETFRALPFPDIVLGLAIWKEHGGEGDNGLNGSKGDKEAGTPTSHEHRGPAERLAPCPGSTPEILQGQG